MNKATIRRDTDGTVDEVVVEHPTCVHFERMGDADLWCGITLADGRMLHVDIGAKSDTLTVSVEER